MKFLIVATALLGVALAQAPQHRFRQPQNQQQLDEDQPQQQPQQQQQQQQFQGEHHRQRTETTTYIPILRFDKEQGNDGSYKTAYETGNNIQAQEEGFIKDLGPDPDSEGQNLGAQVQQGSYSYTSPEGQIITVTYVADEKGFHPVGDHLPTPPPVSPEVQKGLDLIYAGIKAQAEAAEQEARDNPQKFRNDIEQQNSGQYRQ